MSLKSARPGKSSVILAVLALLFAAVPALLTHNADAALKLKTKTWTVKVGAESRSGAVQTMAYGPKRIWINAGDKVHWVANSMEPHTVSFIDAKHPAVEFNFSPYMINQTAKHTISRPGQFRSSGIIAPAPDALFPNSVSSYDLTFLKPGKYHYLCYIHGQGMSGVVIVRKAGTKYPYTQAQYNAKAARAANADIEHGLNLWADALGTASAHHVYIGASDMRVQVNRFIAANVTVHVGETVTFDTTKNTFPIPHTVTFGVPPENPFLPSGDPTNFSGGNLSSGVLLPVGPGPHEFAVTFKSAGTFSYICLIHAGMGMVGQVTVLP